MLLDCDTCTHRKECEREHGVMRNDGDDFRAVCGTHFCRASWDDFKCNLPLPVQFEKDLVKLISTYVHQGLAKPELVAKMKWMIGNCETS